MDALFLITARGGSKGLVGKNIRPLNNKPLLAYSIDFARKFVSDENICLSTDDPVISRVAETCGLKVPFARPANLAGDTAGSREVILHALDYYHERGRVFDSVVLLQPTSPFRNPIHLENMFKLFSPEIDMVVSVKESHDSPYFSLFEERADGFLSPSKPSVFTRRQDAPPVYAYNGSVYIINAKSLERLSFREFTRVRKYVMDNIHSVDIDSLFDWYVAEMIIEKSLWHEGPKTHTL